MGFVGNLLWFVLGFGWFFALGWFIWGAILCLTVIGLPFGIASFRIAPFAALPFGRQLVDARMMGGDRIAGTGIAQAVWVVLAGFWLALGHAFYGVLCCITVIGIPFGMAHFKIAQIAFAPLGKVAVPNAVAQAAIARDAQMQVEARFSARHAAHAPGLPQNADYRPNLPPPSQHTPPPLSHQAEQDLHV
jgi:uncharacterized membrane protein YccF (DUF307 family)